MDVRNEQSDRVFWHRQATVALGATWLVVGFGVVYDLWFGSVVERSLLLSLGGSAFAAACCFWVLVRAATSHARRSGLFVVWSAFTIVLLLAVIYLTGGSSSPLHSLLLTAVVFPAFAHPWPHVLALSLLTLLGTAVVFGSGAAEPGMEPGFFLVSLAITGGMITMAARNRGALEDAYEKLTCRLEDEALHDGLTGCLNRRGFDRALEHEVRRATRYRRPLSLLAVDVDHLKTINDTGGHATGDRAILEVAEALKSVAREVDMVARPGGDEFAMLLPETGAHEAEHLARRVHARLDAEVDVPVTVSIGVAALSSGAVTLDAEGLWSAADAALFVAKAAGGNRTAIIPTAPRSGVGGERVG